MTIQNGTTSEASSTSMIRVASIWLFSITMILGFLANSFIIYIYGLASRKRFLKFQRLMLVIALCDLAKTISMSPLYIYLNVQRLGAWDYGNAGCKLIPALGRIFTNISLGVLLVMIADRSRAKIFPDKRQLNFIHMSRFMVAITVFSILRFAHLMHFYSMEGGVCTLHRTAEFNIASIALIIFTDGLFLVVFLVSFGCVQFQYLLQRHGDVNRRSRNGGSFRMDARAGETDIERETKQKAKVVFMMATLFIVCVFPYHILQLCISFSHIFPPKHEGQKIKDTEQMLLVLNSLGGCVNFFIYITSKLSFREDLMAHVPPFRYLFKVCFGNSSASETLRSDGLVVPSSFQAAGSQRRKGFDDSLHITLMNN